MNNLELAASKLNGRVWQKHGKNRVYLKADFKRNQSAYLDFDEVLEDATTDNMLDGAALKVYTDVWSQGTKWNVNATKQCKHRLMQEIAEATGAEVCETWEEVVLV